jgi:hypothetical protein
MPITLDQVVTATGTSLPISLSITTAQNNEVVIAVLHFNGILPMEAQLQPSATLDGATMTLIDMASLSYSIGTETYSIVGVAVFWGLASAAGSHTVQANIPSFTPYGVILAALAFQGVNTSNPVDVHSTQSGSGTNPSITLNTNYANEVVIGCVSAQKKVTVTPASGFTEDYDLQAGSGAPSNYVSGETEHKSVASAGSVTVSCTLSASQYYGFVAFSLAPPAIVETIVAKNFPMNYLPSPAKAIQLTSKVSGATITKNTQDYPLTLLKKDKAQELKSKWT